MDTMTQQKTGIWQYTIPVTPEMAAADLERHIYPRGPLELAHHLTALFQDGRMYAVKPLGWQVTPRPDGDLVMYGPVPAMNLHIYRAIIALTALLT